MVNSYVIDSPQPSNISYLWNFGSLLAFCLIIQIVTGVTLGMHYTPNVSEAFDSVEHIMRDVNNGWLVRYLHSNTASAFFFIVYLHIGRGLYYGSYKAPRTLVWTIGTIIFILMMATAFLGYVLPYGQMSLWGATVITNLMSAIPWIGQDIVQFIWGGFSVNNATLNRFFALHFVLPFVLAALALMHLIALHDSSGSSNPLGVSGNYDRLPMYPYFIFKDLITIFLFILVLSIFVFFMPNVLGDSENYVMANPMQTPPAIVPEWYLLPFYAILRSIPNKLLGVIAMFAAILALLIMPFTDLSKLRGNQFRPLSKIAFFIFVANFLILMQLGAKHVESPFIEFGQISTVLYFAHFVIIVPFVTLLENSLIDLTLKQYVIQLENNNLNLSLSKKPKFAFSLYLGIWTRLLNKYKSHCNFISIYCFIKKIFFFIFLFFTFAFDYTYHSSYYIVLPIFITSKLYSTVLNIAMNYNNIKTSNLISRLIMNLIPLPLFIRSFLGDIGILYINSPEPAAQANPPAVVNEPATQANTPVVIDPELSNNYTNYDEPVVDHFHTLSRRAYRRLLNNLFQEYKNEVEAGDVDLFADFTNAIIKCRNSPDLRREFDSRDVNAIKLMGAKYGYNPVVSSVIKGMANDGDITHKNTPRLAWLGERASTLHIINELSRVRDLHIQTLEAGNNDNNIN
jgi:ubiquinol-cytochrome c reductase cytochrome b subunit